MERTRRLSRRSGIQLHIQSRHAHGRPASENSLPTDGDKQLSNGVAGNEKTSHHVLLTRQSLISSDSAQVRCCALMGQSPVRVHAGSVESVLPPRRLYILCWRELSRRRLLPAVSPAAGHLTTPTVAGLSGLCENFRPNDLQK